MQNKEYTALVTGGAGFIGSHMVDLLIKKNFKVTVVDNLVGGRESNISHHSEIELITKDIRNITPKDSFLRNIDYIFHFAGIGDIVPSIESPIEYMAVNNFGTINLLESIRGKKIKKFVYAASSSCYGLAETPTNESNQINLNHPYALSKYQGELSAFHWYDVYKIPVNSIRIFNAYGTRSRTSGAYGAVIGVFLKQKIENKPFTVVGDGSQTRDFLYVTDVVRAFYEASITDYVGKIYNLGAGKPQSINRLIELLGGGKCVYLPKRNGEPDCTWADISLIKKDLGWHPLVSFEEGVSLILENIDYWKDAPLWDEKNIKEATKEWYRYM